MTDKIEVFVYLSKEIQQDLDSIEENFVDFLKKKGIDVIEGTSIDLSNYQVSGEKGKNSVTMLLASSVVIATLTTTISEVLDEVFHKPILVYDVFEKPATDSDGNILIDKNGKTLLEREKRSRLLESNKNPSQSSSCISAKFIGFEFEYCNSNKE